MQRSSFSQAVWQAFLSMVLPKSLYLIPSSVLPHTIVYSSRVVKGGGGGSAAIECGSGMPGGESGSSIPAGGEPEAIAAEGDS